MSKRPVLVMRVRSGARLGATAVVAALAIISLAVGAGAETKKQYGDEPDRQRRRRAVARSAGGCGAR